MSKYNKESEKLRSVYFKPYEVLKSYIFGIVLSLFIVSIILMPLFNVLILNHYLKVYILIGILTILLFSYLMFYFKDKALENYNSDVKNVNLFYIRMYDLIVLTIVSIIIYIILFIIL